MRKRVVTFAATSAARARLDDDGIADFHGHLDRLVDVLDGVLGAWEDRSAGLACQLLAVDLVAQGVHRLGAGADELESTLAAHLGEVAVLAEEAVAGVNRVGVRHLGGRNDALDA